LYVFDRRALNEVPRTGFQDIKEMLVPRLRRAGALVTTFLTEHPTPRITSADSYLAVNGWMLEQLVRVERALPGYTQHGELRQHAAAVVDPGALLLGPVLVGPRSRIGRATLIGPTVVGAECVVADGALLSRSILWDDVRVGEGANVDRCILTTGARVAGGEQLADGLRLADAHGARVAQLVERWLRRKPAAPCPHQPNPGGVRESLAC
jgi:NDP-sugar pyrophosphorylase family protein